MNETQVLPRRAEPAGDRVRLAEDLYRRAEQAQEHSRVLITQFQRLRYALDQAAAPIPRKRLLEYSPYARMLARLETMPVIEQAKGILMAQSHCGEAEAFDLLRRASQRSNVPVRELAAEIIAAVGRMPVSKKERARRQRHALGPRRARLPRAG